MSQVLASILGLDDQPVGRIERNQANLPEIIIDSPNTRWREIADKINRTISVGGKLPTPDHKVAVMTASGAEEVNIVAHTIRVLSERNLRVELNC